MYTILNASIAAGRSFVLSFVLVRHQTRWCLATSNPHTALPKRERRLIVAVELDLHGAVLELNAVEALDRRLRLFGGLEQHGTPALGAAGVGVAHGIRLDDIADLLEHLSQVLRGGGPREVAHDDLEAGGGFGATGVDAASLVGATRALEAHDDGAALELGVVQLRDGGFRFGGGAVVDETPALGAATGLAGHFGLDHGADAGAVGNQALLGGLPREVADVAAAAFGGGGVAEGGAAVAATTARLGGSALGGGLVLADGDVAVTEGVAVQLRDRDLRFLDVGVLHDAVPAGPALAAGGNVHERDAAALGEDAS
mmetsp:Transcript_7378/g.27810  ORF Transcript_7378/g.27810 Transcript_7378/m.27810 type:complete len:313 (+) Transcript_7378:1464-2402(+)